eukprot:scaffold15327_cov58-Attheya_sp.AAC.8
MQITTWVLLPVLLIQFGLFVTPILPFAVSIPCTIVYGVLGFLSAYFGYLTSATDPIDEKLCAHNGAQPSTYSNVSEVPCGVLCCLFPPPSSKTQSTHHHHADEKTPMKAKRVKGGTESPDSAETFADNHASSHLNNLSTESGDHEEDDEDSKYCWVCETRVEEHSMHCKYCNKCVGGFDHHCQWLNTCVGKANYPYFFRTVVYTCVFVAAHLLCIVAIIVFYFLEDSSFEEGGIHRRANNWLGVFDYVGNIIVGINIAFLSLNVISFGLLAQLLLFHLELRREKLTTYAYIVRDGVRRRDQARESSNTRSRRIVSIQEAKDAKQNWRVLHLKWGKCVGGVWPSCDPIRTKQNVQEVEMSTSATNGASMTTSVGEA